MSNCLGLYIENNLIKYAKVSKEHDNIKVESFGVKFYERVGDAISQIVEETYSQGIPISVNLSDEMYNYFSMFSLLKKSDLEKAIHTEFDSYCYEKGYNPNVFETRYAVIGTDIDKQKLKIIHISENKADLNKKIDELQGYKLTNISSLPISIPNLLSVGKDENALIVNIEDKTTVTTVIENKINRVDILDEGSREILEKISAKENSYSKSYEICKNTTIYTSEGSELQEDEENYLEDIMPTLYNIVGNIRKIINNSEQKIEKVYITGTAALINNIDLYFQEYLIETNCELLKPYFANATSQEVNIKDLIEVNSAISLALAGLGEGIQGMNFRRHAITSEKSSKGLNFKFDIRQAFSWDLGQKLDKTEKGLLRICGALIIAVIVYSGFSILLNDQMNKKMEEAEQSITHTTEQIELAQSDNEKLKTKINEYTNMIKNLEDANDRITDRNKTRNAIPNLLNQIMTIVPENVQITSIENTDSTHIVIEAKSNKYEQLGFLKAKMKSDVILTNVISTAGQKSNGEVTVKIEGDLP